MAMSATLPWTQAWELVTKSCMYLDREAYPDYLALLDDDYEYSITCYSPDVRKEMIHLKVNKEELTNLVDNIHNHIRLAGSLFRQVSLYTLEERETLFDAMSYVSVTHTNLDGASAVFCVGRYFDRISVSNGTARLKSRTFRMETRDIGPGCHYPI
jgi:methanesulfonate monooxygenase small subunit